jgi:dynein heavy chain
MKRKESSTVFEKLGFPEGMTYGHRSSLRRECSRFLRFAYLIDFLSLEALANIYISSVEVMINRLKMLDDECDIEAVLATDFSDATQTGANRGLEPLFYVQSVLDDESIVPPDEIEERIIDDFNLPPRGTSVLEDWDPLGHMMLEEEKDEDEADDDDGGGEGEELNLVIEPIRQKIVPTIEKHWLKLEPSMDQY